MHQARTAPQAGTSRRRGLTRRGLTTRGDHDPCRRWAGWPSPAALAAAAGLCLALIGCAPQRRFTDTDMETFLRAGPVRFEADRSATVQAPMPVGPYRLVSGDLLELQMPAIVRLLPGREGDETVPYRCRIDSAGRIVLPIVGNLKVAGMTLSQVEATVAKLYYPKYVRREPSIVASVAEYRLRSVSVVGAVNAPGAYELRSNEMTLVSALMKAGGVAKGGASRVRICRRSGSETTTLSIPILDVSIPSRDVPLADGDTIVVEAMPAQVITVVGLVKKPGMYPWDPKSRCTVMDALAYAGGVNDLADPQYVRVYRQDAQGKLVSALVKLNGSSAVSAGELCLKPGDIVAVEQTPRTRTRLFLAQIVRMGLGVNAGASVGP